MVSSFFRPVAIVMLPSGLLLRSVQWRSGGVLPMNRVHYLGSGVLLFLLSGAPATSLGQGAAPGGVPDVSPLPQGDGSQSGGGATSGAVSSFSGQKVRPLTEGPLHEAFLSPRKDRNPKRIEKAPPPPLSERPGIEPPSASAEWIEGYWEWDAARNDFLWVTGTWRVAPPGRFWVNGYWKRDDKGWYRVPGFWSERKTDRLDYRKDGPPQDHPNDEPGDPPNSDCFYIPGQYHPDGDGVVWKKGYWTKAQAGWSWVPAQWIRQPDGWVFQDGYWDRVLEDRGILFTPAEVDPAARGADDLTYQPYSKVAPEMYGQLNGAFGRPNSNYDGYPGVYYDDSGRYYGYGSYGYLNGYYGYLDYPYYGGYGYPYNTTPVQFGMGGGYGDPYGGYGGFGGGGGYGGLWWWATAAMAAAVATAVVGSAAAAATECMAACLVAASGWGSVALAVTADLATAGPWPGLRLRLPVLRRLRRVRLWRVPDLAGSALAGSDLVDSVSASASHSLASASGPHSSALASADSADSAAGGVGGGAGGAVVRSRIGVCR